jgi:hypothetical protein
MFRTCNSCNKCHISRVTEHSRSYIITSSLACCLCSSVLYISGSSSVHTRMTRHKVYSNRWSLFLGRMLKLCCVKQKYLSSTLKFGTRQAACISLYIYVFWKGTMERKAKFILKLKRASNALLKVKIIPRFCFECVCVLLAFHLGHKNV